MKSALPDEAVQRIRAALERSNKIEAIKLYRECHPVGLAEAKQAVEEMEQVLFATNPDWYARHTRYLRRPPSRRIQIFTLIGYSLAAVAYGMLATRGTVGPQSSWHDSPSFRWTACFCFTILALCSAGGLWFPRRKR